MADSEQNILDMLGIEDHQQEKYENILQFNKN